MQYCIQPDDCVTPRLPACVRDAWERHESGAAETLALVQTYAPNLPRVPGMDTVLRLAVRLDAGRTVEGAAAAEYLYRWRLALDAMTSAAERRRTSPFAAHYAPHLLGA